MMLSLHLRAALTLLDQHCGYLHPPTRGWAAHSTPKDHGCPAPVRRHTAVAEDKRGGVHTRHIEGGAAAKAEVVAEAHCRAAQPGKHLGPKAGRQVKGSGVWGRNGENNRSLTSTPS